MASLSQGRTAAAQCGLFTYKSVPVLFEPPCITPASAHQQTCTPCARNLIFYFPSKFHLFYSLSFVFKLCVLFYKPFVNILILTPVR